tara:strand:+ start:4322 stop:5485 length:1164 start_codon:yes stop_codon:yes gene_type:complete
LKKIIKYKEDHEVLNNLVATILNDIRSISSKIKKNENIIFTIANTAYNEKINKPYRTPIRKTQDSYIFGVIVYSQLQSIIFSCKVDGLVDYIFVDCEKKLPGIKDPDYSLLDKFKISALIKKKYTSKSLSRPEFGNISKVCRDVVKKSQVYSYKANDITIDATWLFLVDYFHDLSGKTITIIGGGNIGSKLSLKLVESAAEVRVVGNVSDLSLNIKSINNIKQESVLSKVSLFENKIAAAQAADAVIGCTNLQQVIDAELVNKMSPSGVIIDVGKGNFTAEGLEKASQLGISTWRADIYPIISNMVSTAKEMRYFREEVYGISNRFRDFRVVSGGYIGEKYDIIVDNYKNIKNVLGVCDGTGSILTELDSIAEKNVTTVKKEIKNKL